MGDAAAIETMLSRDDDAVFAALGDRLRERLPAPDETIDAINAIIAAVETDELPTVAAVASAFGRSERWLQQVFRDYVGIGLKWLLQRRRLLAAAAQIRETAEPDWADIAYGLGYSSQQHFITDFKTVLGATPVQYKKGLTRPAVGLGAVGDPDVLHLRGAAQEVVALELVAVGEVVVEAAAGPGLLEVADRGLLHRRRELGVAGDPERVDAVVLGEGLGQRARTRR